MSAALLDVNLLVALAWPNHIHHTAAHAWFSQSSRGRWATAPLTQSSFIRVSSNPRVTSEARSPAEARALLCQIVSLPGHEFWADDAAAADPAPSPFDRMLGHRQVTDAHLLTLAVRHGGRLVTFDGGLRDLVPDGVDQETILHVINPLP